MSDFSSHISASSHAKLAKNENKILNLFIENVSFISLYLEIVFISYQFETLGHFSIL